MATGDITDGAENRRSGAGEGDRNSELMEEDTLLYACDVRTAAGGGVTLRVVTIWMTRGGLVRGESQQVGIGDFTRPWALANGDDKACSTPLPMGNDAGCTTEAESIVLAAIATGRPSFEDIRVTAGLDVGQLDDRFVHEPI